jgi:hypothetical protein
MRVRHGAAIPTVGFLGWGGLLELDEACSARPQSSGHFSGFWMRMLSTIKYTWQNAFGTSALRMAAYFTGSWMSPEYATLLHVRSNQSHGNAKPFSHSLSANFPRLQTARVSRSAASMLFG